MNLLSMTSQVNLLKDSSSQTLTLRQDNCNPDQPPPIINKEALIRKINHVSMSSGSDVDHVSSICISSEEEDSEEWLPSTRSEEETLSVSSSECEYASSHSSVSPTSGAESINAETKKKSARTSKPSLPRLKPMDVDGKVIELPPELAGAEGTEATATSTAFPDAQAQRDLYCPACEKSFAKERGYRQHMRKLHDIKLTRGRNKERRFGCERDGCGKSFYQRSDLRRHERVHLGVKPFQCSLCRKQFTQRGSLYRHIKSSHKDQDPRTLVMLHGESELDNDHKKGKAPRRHIVGGSEVDAQDLPPPLISALPPPLVPLEGKEQAVEGKDEEEEALEQMS